MQFFLIKNKIEVEQRLKNIKTWIDNNWDFNDPLRIEFKKQGNKRSIDQNSLMWKWLNTISDWALSKGWINQDKRRKPEEVWKVYFLSQVFGSETVSMGKESFDVTPSTSELTVGEMQHLLEFIQSWAIDRGIALVIPKESEFYRNIRE